MVVSITTPSISKARGLLTAKIKANVIQLHVQRVYFLVTPISTQVFLGKAQGKLIVTDGTAEIKDPSEQRHLLSTFVQYTAAEMCHPAPE